MILVSEVIDKIRNVIRVAREMLLSIIQQKSDGWCIVK